MPVTRQFEDCYRRMEDGPSHMVDQQVGGLVRKLVATPEGRTEARTTFDWGGNTLFMKAAAFGCSRAVALMIRSQAYTLDHRNLDGKTALDMALSNDRQVGLNAKGEMVTTHQRVIKILRDPGNVVDDMPIEAQSMGQLVTMMESGFDAGLSGTRKLTAVHLFKQLDDDRSGKLSRQELRGNMERMGMEIQDGEFEAFWKSMDTDGSGDIGFREFKVGMAELQQTLKAHEAKLLEGGDDDLSTQSSHQPSVVQSVRTPAESFEEDEDNSSVASSSVATNDVSLGLNLNETLAIGGDGAGDEDDASSEGKQEEEEEEEKNDDDASGSQGTGKASANEDRGWGEEKEGGEEATTERDERKDSEESDSEGEEGDDDDDEEKAAEEQHHHEVMEHFKAAGDAVIVGTSGTGTANSLGAPVELSVRTSHDDGSGYSKHAQGPST
jgi:hypothetical protein